MRIIRASDYRVMPWKNGGGSTTEIAVFPAEASLDSFAWRISMAHVGTDGPFSRFLGIDRTLAVLSGKGITLDSDEATAVTLDRSCAPYSFPGEWAITGRLVNGPIDDLNVMTRRGGWRHRMQRIAGAKPHGLNVDAGLLVLVARADWTVNTPQASATLAPGDSVLVNGPISVGLSAAEPDGEILAIALSPIV